MSGENERLCAKPVDGSKSTIDGSKNIVNGSKGTIDGSKRRTDGLEHAGRWCEASIDGVRHSSAESRVTGEEIAGGREEADVLVRVARSGDDLTRFTLDEETLAACHTLIDDRVIENACRCDDSRAGCTFERHSSGRVIFVAMGE